MMSGQMGHVINWFYENGQNYVIDFMCVAEDWKKIYEQYSSNAGKYVEDLVGRGKDLKSASEDYYAKNPCRNWYYNNAFIYVTDATGYDFYQAECNNWSSNGMVMKANGTNLLYCTESNSINLIYFDSKYRFDYQPLADDMVPTSIKTRKW